MTQHIYTGTGSPEGVVTAPVGSHYIDTEGEKLWFAVYADAETTGWVPVGASYPADATAGTVELSLEGGQALLMEAGSKVQVPSAAEVFSSHEMTYSQNAFGGYVWEYTAAGPSVVNVVPAYGGKLMVVVTALIPQEPPE